MPVSKNRRKNGKKVKHNATKRAERLEEGPAGITLQDLINVVAYQEAHPEEVVGDIPTVEDIDFEDPDTQAVIKAVAAQSKFNDKVEEENEDGR